MRNVTHFFWGFPEKPMKNPGSGGQQNGDGWLWKKTTTPITG
jgi:hypothetical protein